MIHFGAGSSKLMNKNMQNGKGLADQRMARVGSKWDQGFTDLRKGALI